MLSLRATPCSFPHFLTPFQSISNSHWLYLQSDHSFPPSCHQPYKPPASCSSSTANCPLYPHLFPYNLFSTQQSDHNIPWLNTLQWPPIIHGIKSKRLTMAYKATSPSPNYCSKLICYHVVPHHPLQCLLFLQPHQVHSCLRTFAVASIVLP